MRLFTRLSFGYFLIHAGIWAGVNPLPAVTPQMPVAFIPNQGQTDASVRYLATGPKFHALFYDRKVMVRQGHFQMQVQFRNTLPSAVMASARPLGATASYVHGSDPGTWKTGIPMASEMSYKGLWPGIDVRYSGGESTLKAEYLVAPGGSVNSIRVSYDGRVSVEADGSLLVRGAQGEYREKRPVLYQSAGAQRREIPGGFQVIDDATVGFWTGAYDHAQDLIVDPVITYSTLFGGSSQDSVMGVGYDSNLNTYIAGYTSSSDLPTLNPMKSRGGSVDAFVAKFGVGTGRLIYCTFFGGTGDDRALGLAVNPAGEAYITGYTTSTNLPVLNAAQPRLGGSKSAFVAKINAAGTALVYSTYFGGNGTTIGNSIAIDPAGDAAIGGDTTSTNLPASGTFQTSLRGGQDGFILKLQPSGALGLAAYYGGSNNDHIASIAMDAWGSIAIGGNTASTDITTLTAYQTVNNGGQTGFVAFMPGNAAFLFFSTYFGGSFGSATHPEGVTAVAVDANSPVTSVYVAGVTSSSDFPVTAGAYQTTFGGGSDGFIARFSAFGGMLSSSFFGGTLLDGVNALAIDFYGNPHIAGYTSSIDFPIIRPVQSLNKGSRDGFITKLDKTLGKVMFSSYLGGLGTDAVNAVAVDPMCTILIGGQTASTDFPLMNAAQKSKTEPLAGFVTKVVPGWTAVWFYHGLWFVDSNHARGSDGANFSGTVWGFGQTGDIPVVGDWDGSGKRKIGVFRNGTWILDSNNNGQLDATDRTFTFGQAGDIPVVGDWDGTGRVRAGLFRSGSFILDMSGHLTGIATGKSDATFTLGQSGDIPVAADWNGSGSTKVGIFRNGLWIVDYAGDHTSTRSYNYGAAGDFPVVGDWDGSGQSKIGVYRNPAWCLDYDGDHQLTSPGANELIFYYGIPSVWPVIL